MANCIPLTTMDKHQLTAKMYLAAIGAGDPVDCPAWQETLRKWLDPLFKGIGFLLGGLPATFLGSLVSDLVVSNITTTLKIDLERMKDFIKVAINESYDQLNGDARSYVIVQGYQFFLLSKEGWTPQQFLDHAKNKTLTKKQLNWVYWLKALHKRSIDTGHAGFLPEQLDYHFRRILIEGKDWSKSQTEKYLSNAKLVHIEIMKLPVEQFVNVAGVPLEEQQKQQQKQANMNLGFNAVAALAGMALIFGRK